jgi:hypothetical protein
VVSSFPQNWFNPEPGSVLAKLLDRFAPVPNSFESGVRVLSGSVTGESTRWRFRQSAVDPLVIGGVVELRHGRRSVLRLSVDRHSIEASDIPGRPGHVVLAAVERSSGATVQISVEPQNLTRFGIDAF